MKKLIAAMAVVLMIAGGTAACTMTESATDSASEFSQAESMAAGAHKRCVGDCQITMRDIICNTEHETLFVAANNILMLETKGKDLVVKRGVGKRVLKANADITYTRSDNGGGGNTEVTFRDRDGDIIDDKQGTIEYDGVKIFEVKLTRSFSDFKKLIKEGEELTLVYSYTDPKDPGNDGGGSVKFQC